MEKKKHWENIYQTKKIDGVSWYQETPNESIELIEKFSTSNSDTIIDIGCGNGRNMNIRSDCTFIGCDNNNELLLQSKNK